MILPMRTFITPHHARHAPQCEFLHGKLVPYFELPARVDALVAGLHAANLMTLEEPALMITRHDLYQAHDPGLIMHLEQRSEQVMALVRKDFGMYRLLDVIGDDEYLYENNFPKRHYRPMPHAPYFIYDSVSPIGRGTWTAALHAANLAFVAADALLHGTPQVYALCRPPGHHAGRDFAGGYCYLNNAALAAYKLLEKFDRVAIVDVDYHHANGTQDIFWEDSRVFLLSLHGEPPTEYPYYAGYADESGAVGNIVNLPLPPGTSEAAYLAALETGLARVLAFAPQALVVSLGFDTYVQDPMAFFQVDMPGYHAMGRLLARLKLPTVYVQEGGYRLDKLGEMAAAFFSGVLQAQDE